jgi:hypothetical protein
MNMPKIKIALLITVSLVVAACSTCSSNSDRGARSPDGGDVEASTDVDDSAERVDAQKQADADQADAESDDEETPPQACAPFSQPTRTGELGPASIDEASGLGASRAYEGLLWTHNDSGDAARLFLIRPDGALVAEVHLTNVEEAVDWEDMAVGPCEENSDISCVYVADIGDNLKNREPVVIYRFPEPELPAEHIKEAPDAQTSITLNVNDVHATWFEYPEGPRDAEALMVHPQSAAVYVVEKNDTPDAPVYRIPREKTEPGDPAQATKIATLHLDNLSGLVAMITAGDISPNGREFTVRTYLEAFTFCAPAGDDFNAAFQTAPTRAPLPLMRQAEALAYDLDGHAIWITSENAHAPIYRVAREGGAGGE